MPTIEEMRAAHLEVFISERSGLTEYLSIGAIEVIKKVLQEAINPWRLIDTAPKDGTRIVVLCENGDIDYSSFRGGEWDNWYGNGEPTHWQQMPTKPEN